MVHTGKTPSQASADTSGQFGGGVASHRGAASHKRHGDDCAPVDAHQRFRRSPPRAPALTLFEPSFAVRRLNDVGATRRRAKPQTVPAGGSVISPVGSNICY